MATMDDWSIALVELDMIISLVKKGGRALKLYTYYIIKLTY
jgi:hypothetical protein